MRRVPIRLRLTLAFALAMAVVLTATGVFLYAELRTSLDEAIDESLDARAAELAPQVRKEMWISAQSRSIRTSDSFRYSIS